MSRESVKTEADKLMEQFGPGANAKARELMRAALRKRNSRLSSFFGAVVGEVERRTEAAGKADLLQQGRG